MRKNKNISKQQSYNIEKNIKNQSINPTSNIQLQFTPNQFSITVYKRGNGIYSLEKSVLTSNYPQPVLKSTPFSFKKQKWVSNLRSQDKGVRNAKNIRNMCKDLIDGISYSVCKFIN